MKECVDHKGNRYESESDMCRAYGVSSAAYRYRKRQGLSMALCLQAYNSPFSNGENEGFTYNGKNFKSMSSCCKKMGIPYHTVYQRVTVKGQKPEDAINYIITKRQQSIVA